MQHVIVYAIAAGSLFLLFLVTLATPRKVNVRANYWLGFFLFSFACVILDRVLFDTHVYNEYPVWEGLLEVPRFAMAPALYFSVLHFTIPDRRPKASDYLHFIPFFLFFLFILTVVFRINQSPLFTWYHALPEKVRQGVATTVFASLKVQMVLYWIVSYAQLIRHLRNIRMFASTLDAVSLSWLRYFLVGLVVVLFLSLNEVLLIVPAIVPVTHFGYLILVFYLAYFSLRQQEIYPYQPKDVTEIREIIDTGTTRQQRIPSEELAQAKRKLMHLLEVEKVHLDPDLGLPQLAAKAQMSTHDLSFVINEGFQENFFQFINRYRIEEAKILLRSAQHKHLNVLGIAYESVFRSKSTFNITFKKLTGQSPSQFMQSPPGLAEKPA
jgi:AraC-like DNA-binding protein